MSSEAVIAELDHVYGRRLHMSALGHPHFLERGSLLDPFCIIRMDKYNVMYPWCLKCHKQLWDSHAQCDKHRWWKSYYDTNQDFQSVIKDQRRKHHWNDPDLVMFSEAQASSSSQPSQTYETQSVAVRAPPPPSSTTSEPQEQHVPSAPPLDATRVHTSAVCVPMQSRFSTEDVSQALSQLSTQGLRVPPPPWAGTAQLRPSLRVHITVSSWSVHAVAQEQGSSSQSTWNPMVSNSRVALPSGTMPERTSTHAIEANTTPQTQSNGNSTQFEAQSESDDGWTTVDLPDEPSSNSWQ